MILEHILMTNFKHLFSFLSLKNLKVRLTYYISYTILYLPSIFLLVEVYILTWVVNLSTYSFQHYIKAHSINHHLKINKARLTSIYFLIIRGEGKESSHIPPILTP